ncbi:hypothetical protein, partial [Pseudoalteromonas sp. SIMBA_162]|uniref:hypothetical protein n=1 Tax=Pseudoalteromonas sp. SIMBA_162 TaxID=3080867 RepID=UPI003978DA78
TEALRATQRKYTIFSCTAPCLLCGDNNVLFTLSAKHKACLKNNFYHREHRGAARYTEETYYFLVSSPLLLIVFSVVHKSLFVVILNGV